MTEIQGKSILVRVSARFELARVRVIGSRLYLEFCRKVARDVKFWLWFVRRSYIVFSYLTNHGHNKEHVHHDIDQLYQLKVSLININI